MNQTPPRTSSASFRVTLRMIAGLCCLVFAFLGSVAVFAARQGTITALTLSPATAQAGATVTATVTGTAGPCGAVHINWGEGEGITYATETLPVTKTHVYRTAGTFDLRAQGMGNCLGEARARIVIAAPPPPPPPATPPPAQPPPAAAPRLTGIHLTDARVPTRTAVGMRLEGTGACTITLDFGDGNSQEIRALPATVQHAYAQTGRYSIVATPAPPCAERRVATLDVGNPRPPRITGLEVTVPLDGSPSVRAVRVLGRGQCSYTVDFGDGNSDRREGTLPDEVRHNYPAEGRYTVIVTAGAPCEGERRATFTVRRDRR